MSEVIFDDAMPDPVENEYGLPEDVIHCGTENRRLTSIPSPELSRVFSPFAASNPILSRGVWWETDRPRDNVPILDQDGRGSCTGHGAASALMLARDIAGYPFELLSAPFVYALINGGYDAGSSPADAAKVMLNTGVCLMSEFPEPNYLARNIPANARTTAKRFQALDLYACTNFDEMVSAFLLGYACFTTIRVGGGFNNLDGNGVPPVARGMGNHCVAVGDRLKRVGSGWGLEIRNSWTTQWGQQGRFFFIEEHATYQPGWECYAIRSPRRDPDAKPIPKPI